ncbi:hypothetical protein BDW69DRAFT_176413 [Aspergillus filifer]
MQLWSGWCWCGCGYLCVRVSRECRGIDASWLTIPEVCRYLSGPGCPLAICGCCI